MIRDRERERYARQILIPNWGEEGQERLRGAKVLVAGAGGLGSAALTYLAVAGVGTIRIVDADRVERSNLNRQILHAESDCGKAKVLSARERLASLNPDIRIETFEAELRSDTVADLVEDLPIVDALDNLPTRLLLNDVAQTRGLPLFHGAVHGFEGRATTLLPGKTACLRCLYRDVAPGTVPVAGVTPGVIGCIQATEVIKHILGIGRLLADRLLVYDGLSMSVDILQVRRDPQCTACGSV